MLAMGLKKPLELVLGPVTSMVFMLLLCLAQANNIVKYYDFVVKETNFTRLCSRKSMPTVNGSFPGPVIRVNKGDTAYVNVHNHGNYDLTIHWHGVKQPRNPWSDGPEYITQCPIKPGANFTYEITFSTEEGTLWWHAHSDWTRASVHGAIVILPAAGKSYPFPEPDEEQVIILGSWYKGDVMSLVDYALKTGGTTPLSDAYTINGQPGDFKPCSNESIYRLQVQQNKRYLLRVVNAAMNRDFFFAIAQHNLTVVGWDGAYVKPVNTSYIFITPGQTINILVTANQAPGEYYMIITPFYDGALEDFDHSIGSAIFQYKSGNFTPQSTPYYPSNLPSFDDIPAARTFITSLRSLASEEHPVDVPQEVTTRMFITVSMNMNPCENETCLGPDGNRLLASLNNLSFVNPSIDILEAYYSNLSEVYKSDFPDKPPSFFNFTAEDLITENYIHTKQDTKVKVLNYNESVEIVFQGTDVFAGSEDHPIHIHGFTFYLVGIGDGDFNNETDPHSYNFVDPPAANTIVVPKNGWATIRFRADNPGVWLMHCHFDRHLSWGMDTVFIVKNGNTSMTSIRNPPAYLPSCGLNPLLHQVFNISNGEAKEL